jgi:para-nitrobenzyl esterase
MGQSGGGAKVCVLAAMPKAKGLIHKAVPLSGNTTEAMSQDYSRKVGGYILKEAGLTSSEVDKLQEMPWKDYLMLANKALQKATAEIGTPGMRGGFAPVADGISIPKGKFYSDPNGLSSDVPMLLCSTFHEWNTTRLSQELEDITLDKVKETLKNSTRLGGASVNKVGEIIDAYAKVFPNVKPSEIMALVNSNRKAIISTADAKAVQKAPVFVAWFGWQPPMFDKRMKAFHCLDICFWYANTDLMLTHTGGGKRPRALSEKMSGALLQFMKTGNPNKGGLPEWKPYTTVNGETMVLNDKPELKNDPDREARRLI